MKEWIKDNWHLVLIYLVLILLHSIYVIYGVYAHFVAEPRELAKMHEQINVHRKEHRNELRKSKWIKCQISKDGEIILKSGNFDVIENHVQFIKDNNIFRYNASVCKQHQ